MITTEEVLKLAKRRSIAIGRENLAKEKKTFKYKYTKAKKGLKKVQRKTNKIQSRFNRVGRTVSKAKPGIERAARALAKSFEKATIQEKQKAMRRPKRRIKRISTTAMKNKMARLRAMRTVQPVQQIVTQPMQQDLPNSVRGLYNHPRIRELLPQYEMDRIDSMPRAFQKQSAINYLIPQVKQKQLEMRRQTRDVARESSPVEQRMEVDILSGKPKLVTLRRKRDAWTA